VLALAICEAGAELAGAMERRDSLIKDWRRHCTAPRIAGDAGSAIIWEHGMILWEHGLQGQQKLATGKWYLLHPTRAAG
jgi:hypothetical protein